MRLSSFDRWHTIATAICIVAILFGVFGPIVWQMRAAYPGTTFQFAHGFVFDYYQYISWVRDGWYGNLFLTSRYTQQELPYVFIHPFFLLIGNVGRMLHIAPIPMYLVARIVATAVLIGSFVLYTRRLPYHPATRTISCLLLLSLTPVWGINKNGDTWNLIEPVPWNTSFNIIGKFSLPPHHLLALAGIIHLIGLLDAYPYSSKTLVRIILVTIVTGFLNPSMLAVFVLVVFATFLLTICINRHRAVLALPPSLATLVPAALILGYHSIIFHTTLPWSYMYTLLRHYNPAVSWGQYLLSLGPTFILVAIALFSKSVWRSFSLLLTAVWAILPILIYPASGTILPMNNQRLFQSYQYIPMAILGSIGISMIASWMKRISIPQTLTKTAITSLFVLYGIVPYLLSFRSSLSYFSPSYSNVYLSASALRALSFLETTVHQSQVVLAGKYISNLIPSFTRHRSLIGRDDADTDYAMKERRTYDFVDGRMDEKEAREFLSTYRVAYILFGVDTQPLERLPVRLYPFIKEIFTDGTVHIAKVVPTWKP